MAYSTSNQPYRISLGGIGNGACIWYYASEDVHTDVDAADYFSDGHKLGMAVGDPVIVFKSTATIGATLHAVSAVTVGGAATISPAILA